MTCYTPQPGYTPKGDDNGPGTPPPGPGATVNLPVDGEQPPPDVCTCSGYCSCCGRPRR